MRFAAAALPLFFACAGTLFPAEDEFIPPSSQSTDSQQTRTNAIAGRLASDMFFAGNLADELIDSGEFEKILKLTGREDRAQVRARLIQWIRANSQTAASRYGSPPDGKKHKVDMAMPSWDVTPQFMKAVKELERAALSPNMTPEDRAAAARRLFEGKTPAAVSAAYDTAGEAGAETGGFARLPPQDWKVSPQQIFQEEAATARWFGGLKRTIYQDKTEALKRMTKTSVPLQQLLASQDEIAKLLKTDVGGRPAAKALAEEFAAQDKTVANAAKTQQDFRSYIKRFLGRTRINESEAGQLEATRKAFRFELAKTDIETKLYSLNRKAAQLSATASGADLRNLPPDIAAGYAKAGHKLRLLAYGISQKYDSVRSDLWNDVPLEQAWAELAAANALETDFTTLYAAYMKIPELFRLANRLGYPNITERLLLKTIAPRYPDSTYNKAAAALETYKKALAATAGAVASGSFARAMEMLSVVGGGKSPLTGLGALEAQVNYCVKTIRKSRALSERAELSFLNLAAKRVEAPFLRRLERVLTK